MLFLTMVLTQSLLRDKTHVLQKWSYLKPQDVPRDDFECIPHEILARTNGIPPRACNPQNKYNKLNTAQHIWLILPVVIRLSQRSKTKNAKQNIYIYHNIRHIPQLQHIRHIPHISSYTSNTIIYRIYCHIPSYTIKYLTYPHMRPNIHY